MRQAEARRQGRSPAPQLGSLLCPRRSDGPPRSSGGFEEGQELGEVSIVFRLAGEASDEATLARFRAAAGALVVTVFLRLLW
jgi:hypothetical protein